MNGGATPAGTRTARARRGSAEGRALPPEAATYLRTRSFIDAGCLAGVALVLAVWIVPSAWRTPALIGVVVFAAGGVLEVVVAVRLRMRYTAYRVADGRVVISAGALIRRTVLVSTAMVSNVVIVEGPLLRRHGLVVVQFVTIAGIRAVGPIRLDEASALRAATIGGPGSTGAE